MKNVHFRALALSLVCLLSTFAVQAEKINHMYILVEPDVELRSSTVLIEQLIKEHRKLGIKSVFWRAASDNLASEEMQKHYISSTKGRPVSKKTIAGYLNYHQKQNFNSGEALGKLASHMRNFNWDANETLLVILGDLIYKTKFITSRHAYLNDAFINAQGSPFRKNFLNKVRENEILYGLKVVVFNRQNPSIQTYIGQNRFINVLFEQLNQNVRVCGAFYPMNNASLNAMTLATDFVRSVTNGYCPQTVYEPLNTRVQLPQIVKDSEELRVVF